ncbi:LPS translocon maturation chaperone LptM [Xenorhabdus lircayensis]|uniref:LPS-assembly lipoprotein LptM n=1 Tax=Xenorhabdus lircayensis TaxID=2763499 RepID=A0ABS0U6Q2_9GAMM|nr:lipoprotein [Xenorhabdus lircayensis]MBI6549551.1 lipoprotein [Xenorhabdus lircayensis]
MKKQFRWTLTIITLLSLSGCGLKGPLYFPPAETSVAQAPVNKADKVQPADAQQPVDAKQ